MLGNNIVCKMLIVQLVITMNKWSMMYIDVITNVYKYEIPFVTLGLFTYKIITDLHKQLMC